MADTFQNTLYKHQRFGAGPWSVVASGVGVIVLAPIMCIFWLAFFPTENIWPHLMATVLPRYLANSIMMMISVGVITGIIGTAAAWVIVTRSFPGRRCLEWALLFPMAIPAYIGAYALVDFWEYAGPIQTLMRDIFGWQNASHYWFPEIRSRGAAILVLSLALYPYVYLLARSAFRDQSANVLEVARALGCTPRAVFWRVALPMARPAIFAGVAIAMMETLNEFGAVEFFAVQTLTTGIFTVWLEASNVGGAAQIASMILVLILMLVVLEKQSRRHAKFHQSARKYSQGALRPVYGIAAWGLTALCFMLVVLGFIMPVSILFNHAISHVYLWFEPKLWMAAMTSFYVASLAGIVTVAASVAVVFGARTYPRSFAAKIAPTTTIGYAAPGAVLGLGVLVVFSQIDRSLADGILYLIGWDIGLLVTGGAGIVVLAYCVRFFAIAYSAADTSLGRLKPSMGDAARSLGRSPSGVLLEVQLPLIRNGMIAAGLLIFVDSIKELPATLLLRPFGFNTLATRTYDFASLEDIARAAPSALLIVVVSMGSVAIVAIASVKTANSSHKNP